jgi:hypothetical protein
MNAEKHRDTSSLQVGLVCFAFRWQFTFIVVAEPMVWKPPVSD